jgi:hypothetical protein
MEEQHRDDPLGQFAANLLVEVQADQAILQNLADRIGAGSSLKEVTAWLGEKLSRFKLRQGTGDLFGTFEALEFLELGIHGKWALWQALASVATTDIRLQSLDYKRLSLRAVGQRDAVEERRREIARGALQGRE